ncbi:MAG: SDR family NAD(P)-dependent oxidoreductase [Reichenbachiella sp.]|uniref:SDR family oxidoreductase n=1 Tax=Reichenbachiella sp. TaxID=2184521 RepID=UPI0029675BB5|nr:SDR family NAD(P)-dependent oxidoreductase [Reichenbachiella sp.]MDW3208373.1 SDR family NAD(P)-dependent oxidoreductase [Reichenbachiella sp.]
MELKYKTILITGGTSGIGRVLADRLLAEGNTVIILGRNKSKLEDALRKGFETIHCDLSNVEEIENAVIQIQRNYERLDLLFNNAGIQYNYDFMDSVIPLDKIKQEIQTNVTGQLLITQLLVPLLNNASKALIVNTTSGLGAFPKSDGLVYSSSKAALRNFTIGLRFALKSTKIKVLEFIPPVTDTEMTKGRTELKMSAKELIDYIWPQLLRERKILTVPKMRLFLWIAFLFPSIAHKILSK